MYVLNNKETEIELFVCLGFFVPLEEFALIWRW